MMVDDAEESQLKGPIDLLAPYTWNTASRKRMRRADGILPLRS
jgi:hypothetical protein